MGDTPPISIRDAALVLQDIIERNSFIKSEIEYCEPRHEVKDAFPSGKLSEDLLRFRYRVQLSEGLTEMWKWVIMLPPHIHDLQTWDRYELDKGIYSYWKKN